MRPSRHRSQSSVLGRRPPRLPPRWHASAARSHEDKPPAMASGIHPAAIVFGSTRTTGRSESSRVAAAIRQPPQLGTSRTRRRHQRPGCSAAGEPPERGGGLLRLLFGPTATSAPPVPPLQRWPTTAITRCLLAASCRSNQDGSLRRATVSAWAANQLAAVAQRAGRAPEGRRRLVQAQQDALAGKPRRPGRYAGRRPAARRHDLADQAAGTMLVRGRACGQ
jgi:hypothetical protein